MVCVVSPESATVFWNLARCNIVLVVPFRVPKVTPFHFVDSQLLQSSSPSFDSSVQCAISISTIKSLCSERKRIDNQQQKRAQSTVPTEDLPRRLKNGRVGPLFPQFEEQQRDFRTKSHVWSKPVTNYRSDNWYIDARSQHRAARFKMA